MRSRGVIANGHGSTAVTPAPVAPSLARPEVSRALPKLLGFTYVCPCNVSLRDLFI